jgi:purine-binding chemotaxis protein CheW
MENYLTIRVGAQWFGIVIEQVVEVTYMLMLNEVPVAEPDVLGLMTIRDDVLPVIDLRKRFGSTDAAIHLNTPIISVQTSRGLVGLVADDVDNVEQVAPEQHVNDQINAFRFVKCVARLPGRLLLLLDLTTLLV